MNGHALLRLYADKPLDDTGQLDRQLVQLGDVQERVTVDALNIFLVAPDGRGDEQDALPLILLPDAPQVLLSGGAVIAVVGGLPVGIPASAA